VQQRVQLGVRDVRVDNQSAFRDVREDRPVPGRLLRNEGIYPLRARRDVLRQRVREKLPHPGEHRLADVLERDVRVGEEPVDFVLDFEPDALLDNSLVQERTRQIGGVSECPLFVGHRASEAG
jgi:hypothetical protein